MAESTTTTPTDEQPAAAKKTAKKATSSRTKKPTLDQSYDTLMEAFEDEQHPEHAEAVAYFETLAARVAEEVGDDEKPTDVFTAIWAVMRDVRYVGKNGVNEDQHYKFRGIDDVMNALGPAMRRHGLLMFPRVTRKDVEKFVRGTNARGNQQFSTAVQVEVRYRFHFAKGGTDDFVDVIVPGESIDTSDKATAKAMSVALRTAMLQTFALPTYDDDPDQHNPEIETPLPIPAEELLNAVKHASTYDDLDAGFAGLRQHYGDARIAVSKAPNKDGELLDGPAFLDYALEVARAWRAEKARTEQDQDAQGDARAPEQDAREQAPDARAEDAQPQQDERAQQGREVTPAEAVENAQAQTREQSARRASAPAESRQDKLLRLAREELIFQAEVLNVAAGDYVKPALADADDVNSLHAAKAGRYLINQRPAVIDALRQQGMATVAENYERIGQGFPLASVDALVESSEAREQQGAQQ